MYSRCCVQQAGRQERLRMCIDEKEAPIGYIAVAPERWIRDGIAGCVGCAYAGQNLACLSSGAVCTPNNRHDQQHVIFKKA